MKSIPKGPNSGRTKRKTVSESQAKATDSPPKTLDSIINRFIVEIDSLATTLPLAMTAIFGGHKQTFEQLAKFISKHGRRIGKTGSFQIDLEFASEFRKLKNSVDRASAASALVPRSLLVALVSQYDSFLGLLIKTVLSSRPEILNGSEKPLLFSELVAFDSIEHAREHIIESEVDSVLRESHLKQFEWLEKKLGLPLREGLIVWPTFIEVTERRNLFVHTGGQVSAQYLNVCKVNKFDYGKTAKGDILRVDPTYLNLAHAAVFEVGVKLAHVLWRKLWPDERQQADQNLLTISFNLLAEEKYELAKSILDFAVNVLKTWKSADFRLRFVVNRAQAYKWSGQNELALEMLGKEDFSACGDVFKLAAAVLREDYKTAVAFVRKIGPKGGVDLQDYREWPLFKDFRKQKGLESAIQEVFGEPLNKVEVEEKAADGKADNSHENPPLRAKVN